MPGLEFMPIEGIPEIAPGDALGELLAAVLEQHRLPLRQGDIVVLAQKVVSKAEGRMRDLREVTPSQRALELSRQLDGKDARLVELILQETRRIVRTGRETIIVETHHGLVCANAGIDLSNTGIDRALLLPEDPDASARTIRDALAKGTGVAPGVIVSDSFGRPWRLGTTDVAIGVAGIAPLLDYRGKKDRYGYELRASVAAVADEIAGAAELVMGKTRNVPVVLVRGYAAQGTQGSGQDLIRPAAEDLFRDR